MFLWMSGKILTDDFKLSKHRNYQLETDVEANSETSDPYLCCVGIRGHARMCLHTSPLYSVIFGAVSCDKVTITLLTWTCLYTHFDCWANSKMLTKMISARNRSLECHHMLSHQFCRLEVDRLQCQFAWPFLPQNLSCKLRVGILSWKVSEYP